MGYYDLIFSAGAMIGQSCIVFLLLALMFDFMRSMIFSKQ